MITRFYKNGQTTHVKDLCSELMRQGHQVLLIINEFHDPRYARWLKAAKIPYVTTTDPSKVEKCIQRLLPNPQIVHNHSVHTLPLASTLRDLLQIPSVTTVHYLNFDALELLHKQDAVILISLEMQKTFAHLASISYVVENGVVLPSQHPKRNPWRKRVLILAQVTPDKEENFRRMTNSLLAWGWDVSSAGNWYYKGITSHGWVNDVRALLRESDLVVGSGRAVREAMAWGIPAWVLGSFSDGLVTPENVTQLEETNFSGRASKEPFLQCNAASYLQNPSPVKMKELGAFGQERAKQHYSIGLMAEKLIGVYEECSSKCSREKQT